MELIGLIIGLVVLWRVWGTIVDMFKSENGKTILDSTTDVVVGVVGSAANYTKSGLVMSGDTYIDSVYDSELNKHKRSEDFASKIAIALKNKKDYTQDLDDTQKTEFESILAARLITIEERIGRVAV